MESSGAKRKIDQESENVTPAKKSCRQSYTMDFKIRVLNDAKTSQNIRATAKSYGLDHTMVVRIKLYSFISNLKLAFFSLVFLKGRCL